MGLKNDINLLKAAGSKQSVGNKGSIVKVIIVLLLVVVGVVAYMTINTINTRNDLETSNMLLQSNIDNVNEANLEKYSETLAETSDIKDAIGAAELLDDYKNTFRTPYVLLSTAHVKLVNTSLTNANASVVDGVFTYSGSKLLLVVESTIEDNGVAVVNALTATNLFKSVSYEAVEDSLYIVNVTCARKNGMEMVSTTDLLPSTVTITLENTNSFSSGDSAITITAKSTDEDALLDYYGSLITCGYFSSISDINSPDPQLDENSQLVYQLAGLRLVWADEVINDGSSSN